MKKELNYFHIEGDFGGNQEWFTNIVMNMGGCAAATACDSCIYLARECGKTELYPFDYHRLTIDDYKKFSQIMKPYLKPRAGGIKKPEWYIDGFLRYIQHINEQKGCNIELKMDILRGGQCYELAAETIKNQIDAGYPLPYLMLKHKNQKYKDFIWHWFLVTGYEEQADGMDIVAATYGEATRLSLRKLWDTGYEEKGGLIVYRLGRLGTGVF